MAPKTKEQYEEIRRKSRETIKEVALELFAYQGYHSTSISKIAKEAGVSKGLMYNYFDSKEALLHDIIMEAVEVGERLMEDHLDESGSARDQLRALTEGSLNMIRDNSHYWQLLTSLAFQPNILEDMASMLEEKTEATLQRIQSLFEDLGAPDPEKEALLYGAVLDGIVMHYFQMGEQYPLEEMKQYILKKFNLE